MYKTFLKGIVFFKPTDKSDNKMLWPLHEANLIKSNPNNHVLSFKAKEDGRKTRLVFKTLLRAENVVQKTQD